YEVSIPYRDGLPLIYDSGDFPEAFRRALEAAGYDGFHTQQEALRSSGVYRGIGISAYVEGTGVGPFEGASVRLDVTGRVVVAGGTCSQGQSHETTLAQVAADALGVPLDWVTLREGDTDLVPFGMGTFGSRSAVVAGAAVAQAAGELRSRLLEVGGKLLEA